MRSTLRRDREGWSPPFLALLLLFISMLLTSLLAPPVVTPTLGLIISRSGDGTNWTVTFTSVPPSMTQNTTYVSLYGSSGLPVFNETSLYQLEGAGVNEVVYLPVQTGPSNTNCAPGDTILISIARYPSGTQLRLSYSNGIAFATLM